MSKTFALLRISLTLLLFGCAIGVFGAEEPLSDVPELPLETMESMPVAAANGDELLVAWTDRRLPNGIFAARFGRDGQRIDAPSIRLAPSEPYMLDHEPSVAGDVIAFSRIAGTDVETAKIGLVRIANGEAGEPRFVATGWAPQLFSNGRTFLLAYRSQGMRFQALVLSRELVPISTIDMGDNAWIPAAAPLRGGYVAIKSTTDEAFAIRISDDGKAADPIPIGKHYSTAMAADGDHAVVLVSQLSTLRTIVIDGSRVSRAADIARCGGNAVVKSIVRSGDGYLATAHCESEFQLVTLPPLPRNKLATFRFDRNGALLDIKTIKSDPTCETGTIVAVGGALLMVANYDHRNAKIARLTHGRLVEGPFVAVGAPQVFKITMQRDGDSDIVRWDDMRQPIAVFETRITRKGVDPQYRGVTVSNFDFPERPRLPIEIVA
jgi:hypothetical protein